MKIHIRFFLSHDNSDKYQYFMKKVCIFDVDLLPILVDLEAMKRRALRNVIMLLLMTSLAKKRETGVKSVL